MVPVTAGRTALPGSAGRASFAGALRSEFTKIRSVRSTYWTLLATLVVVIGIGALFSYGRRTTSASSPRPPRPTSEPRRSRTPPSGACSG